MRSVKRLVPEVFGTKRFVAAIVVCLSLIATTALIGPEDARAGDARTMQHDRQATVINDSEAANRRMATKDQVLEVLVRPEPERSGGTFILGGVTPRIIIQEEEDEEPLGILPP